MRFVVLFLFAVLLVGCATTYVDYSRFESAYDGSTYLQWVGKPLIEVVKYLGVPPRTYALDSYGNGYVVYMSDYDFKYSSHPRSLTILVRQMKVVDVMIQHSDWGYT